ncbi:MAG: hypothetical protein LBR22_01485 [Desulfovibrio sp.]|nr:hypothetical protein [Desulfovibrio sp.]
MLDIIQYIKYNLPIDQDIGIQPNEIESMVASCGAERWHIHAVNRRKYRRHACTACEWLVATLNHDATIFEPACGGGMNLL